MPQATDAAVDFAIATSKPFAVVPCCVYSSQFRHRRRPGGGAVRNYDELLEYLVAKDPARVRVATLDFEGKNKVVYRLPPSRTDGGQSVAV